MIPPQVIAIIQNCYPRWSPTMYKATLLGMVASAFLMPLLLLSIPMIEFFNGMAAQPKGKAQGTYGRVFGEARIVERPPVPGTIPREYAAYAMDHLGNTIEDAVAAGAALHNPMPITRETLMRGQRVYEIFCAACHGKEGYGDGPVTGPNRFPAPPSLHTDQARGYADGTIFHIVTKGMGKMPSYRELIPPEDRWMAAHYLRVLQRAANPTPEDLQR